MNVIDVPLTRIEVGERRRIDFGDIGALAKGIQRVGLLEPIVVEDIDGERVRLICGERRLRAVALLKWQTIPAQLLKDLSEEQARDIEFEENENRKSLTEREQKRTFRSSKKLVENAKRVAEVLKHSESKPESGPRGGRPSQTDSTRAVASALGTSQTSVIRAEQHVATAEAFPFMQGNQWRQSDVLRVHERIQELPAQERESVADVLGCAKLLDPAMAVTLVENLTAKKPEERQEIYKLSRSSDPRQKSLALTKSAELPPMPDPRLGILDNVLRFLQAAIKPYPNDPLTPHLVEIRGNIQSVRAAVKEVSFDARRQKGAVQ